jgi:hypothetical protein
MLLPSFQRRYHQGKDRARPEKENEQGKARSNQLTFWRGFCRHFSLASIHPWYRSPIGQVRSVGKPARGISRIGA